jgi:hypothetical protein
MTQHLKSLGTIAFIVLISGTFGYALVFRTSLFSNKDTGWVTESYYDFYPDYSEPIVKKLSSNQPVEIKQRLTDIYAGLVTKPEDDLYILKSLTDVCGVGGIDCRGRPNKDVKPLVEAALDYKQKTDARAISAQGVAAARESVYTSRVSLAVAIAAGLVTIIGLVFKGS